MGYNTAPSTETITVKQVIAENTKQEVIKDTVAVPVGKPDIEEVISVYKTVRVNNVNLIEDKVIVDGVLRLQIVYVAATPEGDQPVHHTHAEVPFTSYVELPGAEPGMNVSVDAEIEDVKVKRDNATTFKINAVIEIRAKATDTVEVEVVTGVPDCQVDAEQIRVNDVVGSDTVQTIIDDVVTIPEEKPRADKILDVVDESVVITDTRIVNDKVFVEGEVILQILYVSAEDPSQPVHHVHTEFPFSTYVEIPGATEDHNVEVEAVVENAEIMLDNEEENGYGRVRAYVILKLDVTVTESRVVDIITFVHDCWYESIVLHLESIVGESTQQTVVRDTFSPPGEKPPAEKILDTTVSETQITEKRVLNGKVVINGYIDAHVIYVGDTLEGSQPVHSVHRRLNFHTFLEIPGAEEDMDVRVRVMVEHIQASLDNGDIRIEAVLKITGRVIETIRKEVCVAADTATAPEEDYEEEYPGSHPPEKRCPRGASPYTVRQGDTFFKLARRFNTTVEAIQRVNPGVNPRNLQVGQTICIPDHDTKCPNGTFPYTVKQGDTFYKLAQKYNTSVEAIQRANPGVDPRNLQVSQMICIPRNSNS